MQLDPEFWKDRRVLITGHTGFKGSWLCFLLDELGAEYCGYALEPPTTPSLFELAKLDETVMSVTADVSDLTGLRSLISSFSPSIVIHMAAQSVVLDSYEDPVETYATNVLGTVHVLEAVRLSKSPCVVVNVTTDKCYENRGTIEGYKESDRLGGRDPYSNSKACAELVAHAYRESFFPVDRIAEHGVTVSCARAGNVIGGGDWTPWQLVHDIAEAMSKREKVILRHPDAIRPWQHVLDCLSGYLLLAQKQSIDPASYSGEWNFGPPEEQIKSVAYIVETMGRHWGVDDAWAPDQGSHSHEEPVLQLDSSKARETLGWQPMLPLDQALLWVANWYKGLNAGEDPRELCLTQVRDYLAL